MPDTDTPDLLLTAEEVQEVTNEPLTQAAAASIAAQATDAVRDYCGWRVAKAAEETLTLGSRGGRKIFLPTLKLNDVLAVTENGHELTVGTDYDWDENGVLERLRGRWAAGRRTLVVTINHGYDACPGGISQAIAASVARGVLAPAGGIASETAIGQSVSYVRTRSGITAGAMFVDEEITRLDLHRLRASR